MMRTNEGRNERTNACNWMHGWHGMDWMVALLLLLVVAVAVAGGAVLWLLCAAHASGSRSGTRLERRHGPAGTTRAAGEGTLHATAWHGRLDVRACTADGGRGRPPRFWRSAWLVQGGAPELQVAATCKRRTLPLPCRRVAGASLCRDCLGVRCAHRRPETTPAQSWRSRCGAALDCLPRTRCALRAAGAVHSPWAPRRPSRRQPPAKMAAMAGPWWAYSRLQEGRPRWHTTPIGS
eukprot:scaffold5626_cov229-Prasinococcus_capsulatus_cf.AAC.1